MNLMGFEIGSLRRPLSEMETEHLEKLKKALTDYGIAIK